MTSNLRDAAMANRRLGDAEDVALVARQDRDDAIWRARREDGIGPTEIAAHLTMSLSNVRRIIDQEDIRRGRRQ